MDRGELEHLVMDSVKRHHGQSHPVPFKKIKQDIEDHVDTLGWRVDKSTLESEIRGALVRLIKIGYLNKVPKIGVLMPRPINKHIPF